MAASLRVLLLAVGACVSLSAAAQEAPTLDPQKLASVGRLCTPTHVGFFGDTTAISDAYGNTLHYRVGSGPWRRANIGLNDPHSLSRLPNGEWILNDTDNHRMLQFRSFERGPRTERGSLAGFELNRPHDQIVDPVTGYVYLIDGNRRLFRFKSLRGPVEVWSFTEAEMGYARSLSWFDGKLHVIHSSRGEVLRIDDFSAKKYTRFKSPRPGGDAPAGALASTGLVLNDVDLHNGWYYGTNYFTTSYAKGASTAEARLIRWRSWEDFAAGNWEDLSAQVPEGMVPYYLTAHEGSLFVAIFNHESRCQGDRILTLPY
jgi:hypothetical protein